MVVTIGEQTFDVSAYQAEHVADSLLAASKMWEETAVDETRRVIRQGGGFDHLHPRPPGATYIQGFEAADDARALSATHRSIAVALMHAADSSNSHFLCDPATCEGQRARLARIAAKQKG